MGALEGEINELEIGLDHANKANSEGLKSIKRYQAQLKETIQLCEDEARSRSQIMEQVGISERKAAALSGEVGKAKPCWTVLTVQSVSWILRSLMVVMPSITCRSSMAETFPPSVDWRVPSTPSRLRLTPCFRLLRMPRRSLRRRWWTLPV